MQGTLGKTATEAAVSLCSMLLATQMAAADCSDWPSWGFFETATVDNVADCLRAGADSNAKAMLGLSPLQIAAVSTENPAVLAALLEAGANVNAVDDHGSAPLHLAAAFTGIPQFSESS